MGLSAQVQRLWLRFEGGDAQEGVRGTWNETRSREIPVAGGKLEKQPD